MPKNNGQSTFLAIRLLLYLQIPEGVIRCPCISFLLPPTVYLGAHFLATSGKHQEYYVSGNIYTCGKNSLSLGQHT